MTNPSPVDLADPVWYRDAQSAWRTVREAGTGLIATRQGPVLLAGDTDARRLLGDPAHFSADGEEELIRLQREVSGIPSARRRGPRIAGLEPKEAHRFRTFLHAALPPVAASTAQRRSPTNQRTEPPARH